MKTLIIFSIGLCLIFLLTVYLFEHKLYKKRGLYIGMLLVGAFLLTYFTGKKIITPEKPKTEIILNDTLINEQVCWEYITAMRIDHPKVVLAQAIEESRFNSNVFRKYNNLFGMKEASCRVATVSSKSGAYKHYNSWQESVIDYSLWQLQQNICDMTDMEYIDFLAGRYAENPKYKDNLIKIYNSLNYE
jgi:hypothetical protein